MPIERPVDEVAALLQRIAALNPSLNAFIDVFAEDALAAARRLEQERAAGGAVGALFGKTISLKDLIDVKGRPTTAASRVRMGHVASEDAPLVSRLREADAIVIGKTNLHEFALGTTTDESAFGPSHNPHDLTRSPGGSSGGSAAAVAAGLGWASIGTDTGGSIRIPAAACGVVGLKPSFGEISTAGVVPLSVSLDHVGPIARSVYDAWTVFAVLTGSPLPAERDLRQTPKDLRLGRLGGYFAAKLDVEVRARFAEAIERLRSAGAVTEDVDLGGLPDIPTTYVNVALPEAYAFHARTLEQAGDEYTRHVRDRLEMGGRISRKDYERAQADRAILRTAVDAALRKVDALVLPTLPIPAPKIGAATAVVGGEEIAVRPLTLRLTQLFNLTGHPAISLPCGVTGEGLPCGLQLVGRTRETAALLRVALACEKGLL